MLGMNRIMKKVLFLNPREIHLTPGGIHDLTLVIEHDIDDIG